MQSDTAGSGESSQSVRQRVKEARAVQTKRFEGTKLNSNSDMRNKDIKKYCPIDKEASLILQQAVVKYGLSARTYFRLIKVARTIADLAKSEAILSVHVAEALQYRVRSEP